MGKDNSPTILTWRGKKIADLTSEELTQAVHDGWDQMQLFLSMHEANARMQQVLAQRSLADKMRTVRPAAHANAHYATSS